MLLVGGTNTRVSTRAGPGSGVPRAPVPRTALSCLPPPPPTWSFSFVSPGNTPVLSHPTALAALPQALHAHAPVPSVTGHRRKGGRGQGRTRRDVCQPSPGAGRACTYLSRQWAAVSTHSGDISVPPQKCIPNLRGQAERLAQVSCSVLQEAGSGLSPFVSAMFPKERPPARHQDGRA